MWRSDLRSAAHLAQRFGDRPYGGFFIDDLQGEIAAREGLLVLARKLGMEEADLERYEPTARRLRLCRLFRLAVDNTDRPPRSPAGCRPILPPGATTAAG